MDENVTPTDRVLSQETLALPPNMAARFSRPDDSQKPFDPKYPSGLPVTPRESAAPRSGTPEVPAYPFIDSLSREIPAELRSSKFFSVQLPSGFIFYPFKTLATSLIKGSQQAKFTKAAREASFRYTSEAVASTLSDPTLLHHLTVPDFNWLMYWLRQNSYTRSKMIHLHRCNNPKHKAKVKSGEKHPRSLITEVQLDRTTIKEEQYDLSHHEELFRTFNGLLNSEVWVVDPPRVSDVVEISEYLSDFQKTVTDDEGNEVVVDDEEQAYRCNLATAITRRDGVNSTLAERLAVVDQLDADISVELEQFLLIVSNYGVREFVEIKCKDCGAVTRSQISITAHTFL